MQSLAMILHTARARMFPSLRRRRVEPELMDDPALDPVLHRKALRGLGRLNALGNASGLLWRCLAAELSQAPGTLRVLDVACGSGDVLSSIVRRSRGRIRGLGLDVSPVAIAQAREGAPRRASFRVRNVLDSSRPFPQCDVAICSLFLHHLNDEQAAALLSRMAQAARRLVIVSELERSSAAWFMVWAAARVVTRSHVVHHDSGGSVRAAFTAGELHALARRAGLQRPAVRRAFPARLVLMARTDAP